MRYKLSVSKVKWSLLVASLLTYHTPSFTSQSCEGVTEEQSPAFQSPFSSCRHNEAMQIAMSARQKQPTRPKPLGAFSSPVVQKNEDDASTPDQFVSSTSKVYGSIGAMAGALSGRVAASAAVAVAGAAAGSMLGPIGTVVGGLVGAAAGIKLELMSKTGRLVGGMIGGTIGSVAGKAASVLGLKPSEELDRECQGFSLSSLPKKLLNTHYTSHPKMPQNLVKEGASQAKPGDLIITNDDGNFMIEILQKLTGGKADWTHNYMVDKDGTVMDILIDVNEPTRWPLEHAFTDNSHAKILRPRYASSESRDKTLKYAGDQFSKITYDAKFDLSTDDAQYCQEYAYKALLEGSPEIKIEPRSFLGRDLVSADELEASPDIDEVWSSGSNFWLNWLSHFN